MKDPERKHWWDFLRAPRLSPMGLVLRAGLILAAFAAAHLAGLREYVGIITGVAAQPAAGAHFAMFWAALYVILYVSTIILVPVLLGAAGLLFLSLLLLGGPERPAKP